MTLLLIFIIILTSFSSSFSTISSYKTIHISKGAIKGKLVTSGQISGWAFAGIPHAKPPLGGLRFKKLVEADPWDDVIETTNYRNACTANTEFTFKDKTGGPISEDCMYINVFTSDYCLQMKNCSILAVVHGGNFNFESPIIMPMDVIIKNFANNDRNVVVVTIPYRLGTLGLFNLVPGDPLSTDTNLVIRDVLFSLEWIQKEIPNFGGNPERVTVMGHSAGAAMIYTLAVLPASEGLFNQIICMSGSIYDLYPTTNREQSRRIAQLLKCAAEDEDFTNTKRNLKIIECIRTKSATEILEKQELLRNEVPDISAYWIDGPDGVIPLSYNELLSRSRPLNALIGTVSAEFRRMKAGFDSNGHVNMTRLVDFCTELSFLQAFQYPYQYLESCVNHYDNASLLPFMEDDLTFYSKSAKVANVYSSEKDVFVYSFEYEEIGSAYFKHDLMKAHPFHSEDYIYIFELHKGNFTVKDYEIQKIYTGMLSNFVNTGNPSSERVKWDKWNSRDMNYFAIDFDKDLKMPGMRKDYHRDGFNFWENTQLEKGGKSELRLNFPPGLDQINSQMILVALISSWNNKSIAHDKYLEPELEINKLLHDWTNNNRQEYDRLQHSRFDNIDTRPNLTLLSIGESENGWNMSTWAGFIAVGSIALLLVIFSIVKLCQRVRRRSSYEAF